jgi:membrane protease YdiL (CAAX protease family)
MPSRRLTALLVAALAIAAGVSIRSLFPAQDADSVQVVAADVLSFEIFLGLLAVAGAVLAPEGIGRRLGLLPGRLGAREVSLLMLGTLAASFALDGLLDLSGLKQESALADFERLIAGVHGSELPLAVLAFVLAPGICEELLCRGWIQRGAVRRLGPIRGIALASAVFGTLHLDPVHGLFAAFLGVYLGLVCHVAGSLRPAVACHVVNNLVALLSGALAPDLEAPGLAALLGGGAIAAAALWLVWRRTGSPPVPADEAPETAREAPVPVGE